MINHGVLEFFVVLEVQFGHIESQKSNPAAQGGEIGNQTLGCTLSLSWTGLGGHAAPCWTCVMIDKPM